MDHIRTKSFYIILAIIFVVNFSYALTYQIKPVVDAEAYDEIAQHLVSQGEYRASDTTPLPLDGSITRIGPGYEYFVAGHYLIFGRHSWIIWLTQALLFTATIAMLAICATRLFPELLHRPGIIYSTMLFFGALIDMIQLNGMLMTESLFIFLLTASFFTWSELIRSPAPRWPVWFLFGVLLGLLTLTRPTGLIICALFVGSSCFIYRKKAVPIIISLLLAYLSIQLPWVIRNYQVYDRFIFHSTADGMNLLSGNYPGNHGEFSADFPLFKDMKERFSSPVEFNKAAQSWYINFVITHPLRAAGIILEKVAVFPSLAKTSGFWFHYASPVDQLLTIAISGVQNAIILVAVLVFWILAIPRIRTRTISRTEVFLLCTSVALALTPIVTVIANRHRLPFVLLSLPLVAWSISELSQRTWRRRLILVSMATLIIVISTSIDVYLQFDKFTEHIDRVGSTVPLTNHPYV